MDSQDEHELKYDRGLLSVSYCYVCGEYMHRAGGDERRCNNEGAEWHHPTKDGSYAFAPGRDHRKTRPVDHFEFPATPAEKRPKNDASNQPHNARHARRHGKSRNPPAPSLASSSAAAAHASPTLADRGSSNVAPPLISAAPSSSSVGAWSCCVLSADVFFFFFFFFFFFVHTSLCAQLRRRRPRRPRRRCGRTR